MINEASAMGLGLVLGAGAVVPFLAWQVLKNRTYAARAKGQSELLQKWVNRAISLTRVIEETDKIEQGYINAIGQFVGTCHALSSTKAKVGAKGKAKLSRLLPGEERRIEACMQDIYTIRALKRLDQQHIATFIKTADVVLVQGPMGSGKTHAIERLEEQSAKSGKATARIDADGIVCDEKFRDPNHEGRMIFVERTGDLGPDKSVLRKSVVAKIDIKGNIFEQANSIANAMAKEQEAANGGIPTQ